MIKRRFVIIWLLSYLLPYLACCVASFTGYPCFCFVGSWTISFAIGEAEFKSTNATVNFFG